MKKEVIKGLIAISALLGFGFTPPSGNTTVMVNQSDVLVAPTSTKLINANPEFSDFFKVKGWQVNIDTTPSINPIDGYQTQLKTLQINTPHIDLSDVLLKKLNGGELYLGGGTATTSSISAGAPFSLCATLGADFAGSFTFGNLVFSAASNVLTISDGVNSTTATLSATETQTMVFIQTQSGSTLYLNGEQVATENLTFTAGTFGITGGTGLISRIKAFTFDMSAEGATYTVADYTAGADEPPSLNGGFYLDILHTYANYVLRYPDTPSVSFTEGANLELTIGDEITRDQYIAWKLPRKVKTGETIRVRGKVLMLSSYSLSVGLLSSATSWGTGRQNIHTTVSGQTETIDAAYTLVRDAEYICFYRSVTAGSGAKKYEIVSFEVEIDGALFSLSNYTLNGAILDASGNGNNATVSGQVAGTNDAEIGALYKAFTGNDAMASSSGYVPTVQSFQDALRAALNSDGTAYTTSYQYEDDTVVLTEWTDGEFKVLDANGNLIYWVSTQWGAQMGGDYTTNDATDLNAKIFYTCPENEVNGAGKGREWIEYVHNDVSARTIYEHAQGITGSPTPTIGGIIIQPNFSGTTVGGTSIQSIFGKNVLDAPSGYQFIYLKASPTNLEKTKTAYPIWRTIRPIPVQGGN